MPAWKKSFSSRRAWIVAAAAAAGAVLLFVCSLFIGSVRLSAGEVFAALIGKNPQSAATRIVLYLRLPRALAALIAGAALAVSGALLQSVLHNPLASSGIIGVNAGAGMFSLIGAALFPAAFALRPLFAVAGAVLAVLAVYAFSVKTGASKTTLILSGVAVSSFFTAIIDALITIFPDLAPDRLAFVTGGFSGVTLNSAALCAGVAAAGLCAAFLLGYDLNVLSLGDEIAASVGLRVKPVRFTALITAGVLTGAAVSLGGLIGFVGLIAPHLVRLLCGRDNRLTLPVSALAGACLTLVCDLIARTLFSPYELPVGILLSFLGAPFFILLLLGKKRGGGGARA